MSLDVKYSYKKCKQEQNDLIFNTQVERRLKLYRFSPWQRFKGMLCSAHAPCVWLCPGCDERWWRENGTERREIGFEAGGRVVREAVCEDCFVDFRTEGV